MSLLPCPFCGEQPISVGNYDSDESGESYGYWAVECRSKGCGNNGNNFCGVHGDSQEHAEGLWNRRRYVPQQSAWIACSERMPKSGEFVLAFVKEGDRTRRIRAFYAEKGKVQSGADDGDWVEYVEEEDEFYLPAGWYEANEFEETHWHVNDPVTHWMPLPAAPTCEGEIP